MEAAKSKIENFFLNQATEIKVGLESNPNYSIANLAVTTLLSGAVSKIMLRSFRSGALLGVGMYYGYNRI